MLSSGYTIIKNTYTQSNKNNNPDTYRLHACQALYTSFSLSPLWNEGTDYLHCIAEGTKAWEGESPALGHATVDKARGSAQAPRKSRHPAELQVPQPTDSLTCFNWLEKSADFKRLTVSRDCLWELLPKKYTWLQGDGKPHTLFF